MLREILTVLLFCVLLIICNHLHFTSNNILKDQLNFCNFSVIIFSIKYQIYQRHSLLKDRQYKHLIKIHLKISLEIDCQLGSTLYFINYVLTFEIVQTMQSFPLNLLINLVENGIIFVFSLICISEKTRIYIKI